MAPSIVIRHRKERLSKCSLRGLEGRADLRFHRYPDRMPEPAALAGALLLAVGGPLLSPADAGRPLLLLDATWRLAPKMEAAVLELAPGLERRGLPPLRTAYPRRQTAETECPDPAAGLASVEALWAAYLLTGRAPAGLLDGYRWADELLARNAEWLAGLSSSVGERAQ